MEQHKALEILKTLMEKDTLTVEEKEAVWTAIGMLGWADLSKSRMKLLKAKRDKSTQW
jgi:hypothetical protein